jgi:hypothetical protein
MTDVLINPAAPVNVSQLAAQSIPYIVDVGSVAVMGWSPGASVAGSALMRPTNANLTGFVYQSGAIGQTGLLEPAWPKTAGGTVVDGSITWTAIVPPAAGQDTVASATWAQASPPDGTLTITGQAIGALTATAYLGAGTPGNIYTVNAEITMHSGAIFRAEIIVAIV